MDRDTQKLVRDLRRGRREAWSRLYEAHAEGLWRQVARLLGGSSADVADVVQEVFLSAARSVGTYDPAKGSPRAWLSGIARRQVALRFRRETARLERARRWWLGLDGTARQWLTGAADAPPEVLASKELAALVRAALLELPGDYASLLTRKYLDGASAGQIADETASTAEAVRARLMRARQAFRKAFGKLAGDDSPSRSAQP
jgi:RNA polymerase sigma-70 factor (ECF subfamily)